MARRRRPDEWAKFSKDKASTLLKLTRALRAHRAADAARTFAGRPLAARIRKHSELKRGLEQAVALDGAREDRDYWRGLERAYEEAS